MNTTGIRQQNEQWQRRLEAEGKAFARTKRNTNTPWERPVKPVTLGEWERREKQ
jgi:hypothetical protein